MASAFLALPRNGGFINLHAVDYFMKSGTQSLIFPLSKGREDHQVNISTQTLLEAFRDAGIDVVSQENAGSRPGTTVHIAVDKIDLILSAGDFGDTSSGSYIYFKNSPALVILEPPVLIKADIQKTSSRIINPALVPA